MGKEGQLTRKPKLKKSSPLTKVSSPTSAGQQSTSQPAASQKNTSQATSTVASSAGKAKKDVTDRMDDDQKAMFENLTDESQDAYRRRTSRMNDEDVDKYNLIYLTDYDLMLGSVMDGGRRTAKDLAKGISKEASLRIFGYYGGTIMHHKSGSLGYKMRESIKNYARSWAQEQVDDEFDKKVADIGNVPDRQLKIEELEMRKLYLKAHLYKSIKEDLVKKLESEADSISDGAVEEHGSKIDTYVRRVAIFHFKSNLRTMLKKNKKMSHAEKLKTSKLEALMETFKSKDDIGSTACDVAENYIMEYTKSKSFDRQEKIIQEMTYVMDQGKSTYKGVTNESAVNYLYGDESEEKEGEKKLDDKRRMISQKMSNNEIMAPDLNRGLKYFSMFAMNNVPKNGDTATASTSIKVPVSPGVSLKFKVGGESEREGQYVTSKVNVGIGASGDVGIANLSGEIGGFIQAKAKTPENMATLISYVMYRKARESKVMPHKLTDTIWGMGNRTGEGKYKEAETFGAMAEKRLFGQGADEENKVVRGEYAKLAAELGDMDEGLGGELSLKGSLGRAYSKSSFEQGHSGENRLGRVGDYKRFGQKTKGDLTEAIVFEAAIGGLNMKGTATAELKLQGKNFKEFTISGSGQYLAHGGFDGEEAVTSAVTAIGDILANLKKIKGVTDKVIRKKNVKSVGNYDNDFQKNIEKAQVGSEKIAQHIVTGVQGQTAGVLSAQSGFKITFSYTKSKGEAGEFSIALDNVQSVGVSAGVFKAEVEKTHRIVKWSSKDGVLM